MSHSTIGLGPAMARRTWGGPGSGRWWRRRIDADHHVADAGGDGRCRVPDVDLAARAPRHGRVREDRVDAEIFREGHGRVGVADPVDVGQRQPGVLEGAEDHRHLFELTPAAVELTRGGRVVVMPTIAAAPRSVRSTRSIAMPPSPVRRCRERLGVLGQLREGRHPVVVGLLGQAQHAFPDDVALHLVGTAVNRGAWAKSAISVTPPARGSPAASLRAALPSTW